jgi:hypothetical protein
LSVYKGLTAQLVSKGREGIKGIRARTAVMVSLGSPDRMVSKGSKGIKGFKGIQGIQGSEAKMVRLVQREIQEVMKQLLQVVH